MIWYSTRYFNQKFVDKIGVTEITNGEGDKVFQAWAIIQGVTYVLGESDDKDDAQKWIDTWVSDGEKSDKAAATVKPA